MTRNASFPSIHQNSILISLTCKMLYNRSLPGWLQIFSLSTLSLIGLKQLHDSSLTTSHSARNPGFIFDKHFFEHFTFYNEIFALIKSCYYHIRDLRCFRSYLDFKTASTIATSIVHSKLDYCNSLYHNFPNYQLNQLQQILNSLARAVVKAPKSSHITAILKFLYWLKVNERIEYKLLSFKRLAHVK